MSKLSDPLILFNPQLPKLSKNERAVLKLLVEAGKLIAPIYKLQEDPKFPGANFYPHDATKGEIQKASDNDSQILSPYTVVNRQGGKLVATAYHKKYADLLKPIADKLEQAADISKNEEFARLLRIQAKALTEGSYEEASIARLKMPQYILDISIGPTDRIDDRLLFIKTSYQCWVGVVDMEGTERLINYKSIVLGVTRKALVPSERIDSFHKVKVLVDDVILFSGLVSRTKFVGINLPYSLKIVEKYGSEITLFNQPNDLRLKEQILPTFNKIFPKVFREEFTPEDIRRGYLRATALHELAHSHLHYRHAVENLQDLFIYIDELAATVLGLRMAGSLLLKDRITDRQLESMTLVLICRSFSLVGKSKEDRFVSNYALGGAVFINFMLKNGALKQKGKMIVPNMIKVFMALQELLSILEELLSHGTRKNAEDFIKKYT